MSTTEPKPEQTVSLLDLIDGAMLNQQDADIAAGKTFGFPLRPSAAGKCARALAYELNEHEGHAKYPPDYKNPNVMRLLDLGHAVEKHLIHIMRKTGLMDIKYSQQVVTLCRLPNGRLIEGSMDLVVFAANGMKIISDCKTKGSKWSAGYASSWADDEAKYERMDTLTKLGPGSYLAEDLEMFLAECNDSTISSNCLQLNAYARTEFILERGIEYASIIQYAKNDSMLREIRFKTSQKLAEDVNQKFITVANAIYSGAGPEAVDRTEVLGSMACAFCRFKESCWPEVDTKKEFFKGLPEKYWATGTDYLGERGDQLEAVFADYVKAKKEQKAIDTLEEKMLRLMLPSEGRQVKKVKFKDGTILEAKFLKSPYPSFKIRPGKV